MLAGCLKGRVRYGCTTYPNMDCCYIFELSVDSKAVKRFSWETVNTYFIDNGYKTIQNPRGKSEYWSEFHNLLNEYDINRRTEYTDGEFCTALEKYRNQSIQESVFSDNPIVRMFAIFDRRVGKRTIEKLKEEISTQPQWLQQLYLIRATAEKVM